MTVKYVMQQEVSAVWPANITDDHGKVFWFYWDSVHNCIFLSVWVPNLVFCYGG